MNGSLKSHFKMLESSKHMEQLRLVLSDIACTMPNEAKFKSNCKQIIGGFLDLLFQNPSAEVSDLVQEYESKRSVSKSPSMNQSTRLSQFLKETVSKKRLSNNSYSALKKKKIKKEDSFLSPSNANSKLGYISDFKCITGSVTFPKGRREFEFPNAHSPGPAAYSPRIDAYKPKSPTVSVPIGGKRFEFNRDNSPGPMTYYPQVHYLSK